jgi:hypothetical protein
MRIVSEDYLQPQVIKVGREATNITACYFMQREVIND